MFAKTLAFDLSCPEVTDERTRARGATFVRLPGYGTRSSTVVLIDRSGRSTFVERSFSEQGDEGTVRFEL